MPTTETSPIPAILEPFHAIGTQDPDLDAPQFMALKTRPDGVAHHPVVEAPRLIQVYISGASGLGVNGLLKSVSRGGLQVLTPIAVPLRSAVSITIAGCCSVPAEVFYCIKKSPVFQVGIVFSSRHRPEVSVGAFAVIRELDESFTTARGHVLDVSSSSLSILCKSKLTLNSWVRVEYNGWVLFGEVEGVVVSSMVASCVGIHVDAAFPQHFAVPAPPLLPPGDEGDETDGRL
jgi:hypothetical protein